jgi:HEAT repeat protein
MKNSFFLKLGIAIVAGFGLLLAGFYVYEPVWFKIQEYRLLSDDPATRDSAASAIAEKGKSAIPRVRKWLKSPNDNLVIGACKVLENMSGVDWIDSLPEIETILATAYSVKTNVVAELLFQKDAVWEIEPSTAHKWKRYNDNARLKTNLCLYAMLNLDYEPYREIARFELYNLGDGRLIKPLVDALEHGNAKIRTDATMILGSIGDKRAVLPLISSVVNDSDVVAVSHAIMALGDIGDNRAIPTLLDKIANDADGIVRSDSAIALGKIRDLNVVPSLISSLEKDSDPWVRRNAIDALGELADNRAVTVLINTLESDTNTDVRWMAAYALFQIGDNRAIEPLIQALENDKEYIIRERAAEFLGNFQDKRALNPLIRKLESELEPPVRWRIVLALGYIGDRIAFDPLIKVLKYDPQPFVRYGAAIALASIGDTRAINPLELSTASDPDNDVKDYCLISLMWLNGKEYPLIEHKKYSRKDEYYRYAKARRGDLTNFSDSFSDLYGGEFIFLPMHIDFISRMPDECPRVDYMMSGAIWRNNIKQFTEWFEKNKSRLAWDAEKRKYYLKPE